METDPIDKELDLVNFILFLNSFDIKLSGQ